MGYYEQILNAPLLTQIAIGIVNLAALIFWIYTRVKRNLPGAIIVTLVLNVSIYILVWKLSGIDVITYLVVYQLPALLCFVPILGISMILGGNKSKKKGVNHVKIPVVGKKPVEIDVLKGASIQGAPGSGKTWSGAGWIVKSLGDNNVPGLIHDYKDGELAELMLWYYRDSTLPINIFYPADPSKSCDFNFISPELLQKREDFIILTKALTNNVIEKDGKPFFREAAEGAIAGVIMRLKEDFPHYCSFAYLVAIFLEKSTDELLSFIEANSNAKRQASTLFKSAGAGDQMAGVLGSLSNAFRKFDVPNVFFVTKGSDFSPKLNQEKHKSLTILVNNPSYDEVYKPLLAVAAEAMILKMSVRGQDFSYLLWDEAPMLPISRMPRVPATMRSFNVGTIYMLQDKIQAANQMGEGQMKEILANLSTQMLGKTNDPDTARFFESYFEQVKVKQISTSKTKGLFSFNDSGRVNVSQRDEKKVKSHEMFKRDTGEFFIIDEKGRSHDVKIKKPKVELQPLKKTRVVTENEITANYNSILSIAKRL